jgi:hypothetical protein
VLNNAPTEPPPLLLLLLLLLLLPPGGAPAKKERKPRKKKDPNAPKKALSAFMYFSNANRERIKTANPGIPFGQVGAVSGSVNRLGPMYARRFNQSCH